MTNLLAGSKICLRAKWKTCKRNNSSNNRNNHTRGKIETQSIADTHIPAGSVSVTWNQAGSPYIIDGIISIADVDQLVIDPGVRVIFPGHCRLIGKGGAVYCSQSSQLLIDLYIFRNNFASRCGGAIACGNSGIVISGSSVIRNGADEGGGGLYCLSSGPQVINVTFCDNSAIAYGGPFTVHRIHRRPTLTLPTVSSGATTLMKLKFFRPISRSFIRML